MAKEGEVWEEIRDALHQLAEQGERQTALLEKMMAQGKRARLTGRQVFAASVLAILIAVNSVWISLYIGFGESVRFAREIGTKWLVICLVMTFLGPVFQMILIMLLIRWPALLSRIFSTEGY